MIVHFSAGCRMPSVICVCSDKRRVPFIVINNCSPVEGAKQRTTRELLIMHVHATSEAGSEGTGLLARARISFISRHSKG